MRILLVSVNYDDVSRIGSVRPRSFARWLVRFGHEVTVITRDFGEAMEKGADVPGVEVVRLKGPVFSSRFNAYGRFVYERLRRHGEGRSRVSQKTSITIERAASHVLFRTQILAVSSMLYRMVDDYLWARTAAKRLSHSTRADVVFATHGPLASVLLGARLSGLAKVYIVDFRDAITNASYPKVVNFVLSRLQGRVVGAADAVTAVSSGLADAVRQCPPMRRGENVHVIPNGFEPELLPSVGTRDASDRCFRIGYTGMVYPGLQDASALFNALRDLSDKGVIDLRRVEVHYAGRTGELFASQAAEAGLSSLVVHHGAVDKNSALRIQQECDVLLVLAWNRVGSQGILSGKVYDYLGAARPILAITAGEVPGAELSRLIDDLEVGYAFEYAREGHDLPRLRDFLVGHYCDRVVHGVLPKVRSQGARAYRYEALTRRLEVLCGQLLSAEAER